MKDYLKQKYNWWAHFLWSIKVMVKCTILSDYSGAKEAYYWIKIHVTYKSKRIK